MQRKHCLKSFLFLIKVSLLSFVLVGCGSQALKLPSDHPIVQKQREQQKKADWGDKTYSDLSLNSAKESAMEAIKSPHFWLQTAGALLLTINDFDEKLTSHLSSNKYIFGSRENAASQSNNLAFTFLGIQSIGTALLASSGDSWVKNKAKGLSAILLIHGANYFANKLFKKSGRLRPDGSNYESFPSGHAAMAASFSTVANHNLDYINMNSGLRTGWQTINNLAALGTGLARVEAGRHYVTDILIGYATGSLITKFLYKYLITPNENLKINVHADTDSFYGGVTFSF